jgi:hypothetical protein
VPLKRNFPVTISGVDSCRPLPVAVPVSVPRVLMGGLCEVVQVNAPVGETAAGIAPAS